MQAVLAEFGPTFGADMAAIPVSMLVCGGLSLVWLTGLRWRPIRAATTYQHAICRGALFGAILNGLVVECAVSVAGVQNAGFKNLLEYWDHFLLATSATTAGACLIGALIGGGAATKNWPVLLLRPELRRPPPPPDVPD